MVKFGLNGFGRIGRLILRAATRKCRSERICPSGMPQLVAINDPKMSVQEMAYLLCFDSTHGLFQSDVKTIGTSIQVDGQIIEVSHETDPCKIPWNKQCTQYVVEASGTRTTIEAASAHLACDSVTRVLITAPSKDAPTYILGVNHECFNLKNNVISLSSCTSNCLIPLLKIINDSFGIQEALMTSIHAVYPTINIVDNASKNKSHWREARGGLQNLIPTLNDCPRTAGLAIPDLEGKIQGITVLTPVPNVSMLDLNVKICKTATYPQIKCKIREAAETCMKGIVGYTEDLVVSSDIVGDSRSVVFDASAGLALSKCFVKLVAWYDNEWAYACRVVEMLNYMASRENCDKQ